MAVIQCVSFADQLHASLRRALEAHAARRAVGGPTGGGDPGGPDEEHVLFADHDARHPRGCGYFNFDDAECRSRRLDMRGPLDRDPGPIPMEEGSHVDGVIELRFEG